MDKYHLTTTNNNNNINMINKNIFHTSLPTVVNISNNDSHIDETDCFLNEHDSSNILSDLPDSCFVEKAFYWLRQTTQPRYQCLKLITWP
ncbi:unnamed protein product [Rotaria sordida]|nr:unnamed protein product [Rotaria sordida]CAF1628410.1 unnamed protein product [Rotaria sordida]